MAIAASDLALGGVNSAKNTLNGLTPKGQFASDHHYVAGAVLLFVGVIGAAGSVTGSLAAMIAGLFTPNALYTTSSGGTKTATSTTLTGNAKIFGTSNPGSAAQAIQNVNSPAQIWADLKKLLG